MAAKKIPPENQETSHPHQAILWCFLAQNGLRSCHRLVREILMARSYIFPIQSTNFANLSKGQVVD